ncbi:hypothetical protein ACFL5V_11475 [Fibrobacterota bacterium]
MRNVMIATPCLDGRVTANYCHALVATTQLLAQHGINCSNMFITNDALIERARNDLLYFARSTKSDDVIFIDSDIVWEPVQILRLLSYEVDFVGGTYRKKYYDREEYPLRFLDGIAPVRTADLPLVKVEGLPTGFMRVTRDAINRIWDAADKYYCQNRKIEVAMAFNAVLIRDAVSGRVEMRGEDYFFCDLWRQKCGGDIWLDTGLTVRHTGEVILTGDVGPWIDNLAENQKTAVQA